MSTIKVFISFLGCILSTLSSGPLWSSTQRLFPTQFVGMGGTLRVSLSCSLDGHKWSHCVLELRLLNSLAVGSLPMHAALALFWLVCHSLISPLRHDFCQPLSWDLPAAFPLLFFLASFWFVVYLFLFLFFLFPSPCIPTLVLHEFWVSPHSSTHILIALNQKLNSSYIHP